ncbi:MAG TPA: diaminopimelate decarboxylase [Burkholderiaceae bacterium]|nr:diaminopimelate decarboxylase [Burkholderiaceae bacterium]
MTVAPRFQFRAGILHAEDVPLTELARQYGTPLYVYSRQALHDAWQAYQQAIGEHDVLICYGMKANSNLAILNEFHRLGSGFDIVSGGELARVLEAGGDAGKIVFSGVGKQTWEIKAALQAGVKCFNVESESELERIADLAAGLNRVAPVSLRVNPDVDAQTHPYISTGLKENKFGVDISDALSIYQRAQRLPSLNIVGLDCHIGSQITEVAPYLDALDKLIELIHELAHHGIQLKHLDLGGGIGIRYADETPLAPSDLIGRVLDTLKQHGLAHLQLVLEPGRSLTGSAGVLLTRVEYLKHGDPHNFAIVDAAMNDLMRPTLYDAWHDVEPVRQAPAGAPEKAYDVVGPICESADWLARNRSLALKEGDLLAIMSAGAYAFSMSSQYNSRPRAAEIMVDGSRSHLIRERETVSQLFAGEHLLS